MKQFSKQVVASGLLGLMLLGVGCSGKHLRINDDGTMALSGCYPLPNCVSSTTWILYNRTSSFEPAISPDEAWIIIKDVIRQRPRTKIVEENDVYVHAKCTSRVFRFVDNLELLLHPERNRIDVRSSSTVALWDLLVNHLRVYKLRKQLEEKAVIK